MKRNLILAAVLILIVGAIFYIESFSPKHAPPLVGNDDVATSTVRTPDYASLAAMYPMAQELVHPDGYINTGGQPITNLLARGPEGGTHRFLDVQLYQLPAHDTVPQRVVQKYKDYGLEIIGVHFAGVRL